MGEEVTRKKKQFNEVRKGMRQRHREPGKLGVGVWLNT